MIDKSSVPSSFYKTSRVLLFDVETNGFDYTKVHCIAAMEPEVDPDPILFTDVALFELWVRDRFGDDEIEWVAHNACGFDYWVINEMTSLKIEPHQVVDTSVIYKLADYKKYQTFSLDEIGQSLGQPKGESPEDWDVYTPEMGQYCKQDVRVLEAIWNNRPKVDHRALHIETQVALVCAEMQRTGFKFNTTKAEKLLADVTKEMEWLEKEMRKAWPPELVEDRRIKWRVKEDGTPYATCLKAMDKAPKWKRDGDELILYDYKEFNPGSSKDRVDKLWEAGWKPYDKTKGHIKHEREKRWRR